MSEPLDPRPYESPRESASEVFADVEIVQPEPWGFWATIGWTLLGGVLWTISQVFVVLAYIAFRVMAQPDADMQELLPGLETDGLLLSLATLVSAAVCWAYLTLVCRLRGWRARDYLALDRPRLRTTMVCLGILAVFIVMSDSMTHLLGRDIVPEFMIETYTNTLWPPLLFLALVVGAPIGEELLFRGFAFRGLVGTVGAPVTIVATSITWAAIHLQYDPYGIGQVFLAGIMLGTIRHITGSTTIPIILHAAMNTVATVETIVWIHHFGE